MAGFCWDAPKMNLNQLPDAKKKLGAFQQTFGPYYFIRALYEMSCIPIQMSNYKKYKFDY